MQLERDSIAFFNFAVVFVYDIQHNSFAKLKNLLDRYLIIVSATIALDHSILDKNHFEKSPLINLKILQQF